MSKPLFQPRGQKKRRTDVAVVRLMKRGIRFEIASYKNKVLLWRSGEEKDLSKVLLLPIVYSNIFKGDMVKSNDLIAGFGTNNHSKVCLEILGQGKLQVTGKEKKSQLENLFNQIGISVMLKTAIPGTNVAYSFSMIAYMMHQIHFVVKLNRSSKKQVEQVIYEIRKHFPMERVPMRLGLHLTVAPLSFWLLVEKMLSRDAIIVSMDQRGFRSNSMICYIQPRLYEECCAFIRDLQGKLEILE